MKYKYNKYNEKELAYFNKKIPVVEKINWFDRIFDTLDEWFTYFAIVVMASAAIWIFVMIYRLSLFSTYIKSIK